MGQPPKHVAQWLEVVLPLSRQQQDVPPMTCMCMQAITPGGDSDADISEDSHTAESHRCNVVASHNTPPRPINCPQSPRCPHCARQLQCVPHLLPGSEHLKHLEAGESGLSCLSSSIQYALRATEGTHLRRARLIEKLGVAIRSALLIGSADVHLMTPRCCSQARPQTFSRQPTLLQHGPGLGPGAQPTDTA